MTCTRTLRLLAFTLAAIAASTARADLISSFDAGLEGWTGSGGTVSQAAAGGNTGGFLQQSDAIGTWMTVSAPAKFQGNLSTFLGGTISFDGKNINGVAANLASPPWFGTITITGSSGTASRALTGNGPGSPPADGNWHTYTADLSSAGWIGNLGVAMTNVTGITVVLEFNDVITETAGFDNFRISPVPEPETWAMLVAGLGLLGLKVLRNARPVQRS